MPLHSDDGGAANRVSAYGKGHFVISGRRYETSLIVTPERVVAPWPPTETVAIDSPAMDAVLELEPAIILLGTGRRQLFPDSRVYARALARGIGVEIMDTAAACRTYDILMAESRRVAAALILIES